MNIPDLMFEREKLRSQIKKWKWLFVLVLLASILIFSKNSPKNKLKEPYVAKINIEGVIVYDPKMIKKIKELENSNNVKAIILNIDSPGSVAFAGEELFVALKSLSQKKPVVSVIKTLATSGGYMAALASNYIVARNMSLTGSIGVLWQSFEVVEMAKKLGINFVSIKSSPLKASPNPMEITTDEAKNAIMETIEDNYEVFLQMLIANRKIQFEEASKLANGKVYSGLRAKELGLIDEIGGENEAIMWLEKEHNIPSKTKIEDITWDAPESLYSELIKFIGNANKFLNSNFFNTLLNQSNSGAIMLK